MVVTEAGSFSGGILMLLSFVWLKLSSKLAYKMLEMLGLEQCLSFICLSSISQLKHYSRTT